MTDSLQKYCKNFHLYIFAFCDESYDFLKKLNLKNATVIPLSEFEDEELLKIKPTRTRGEYCWTSTSSTILYCLERFKLENCTYIDADLCFYSDPSILIEEMGEKSILITEHRYIKEHDLTSTSGKYCVQFITFKNDKKGLKALKWWRNECLKWCYNRFEDGKFGDQKYLDDWTERFDGVHVLKNLGGGLAPWNMQQYLYKKENNKIFVADEKREDELVFYHYHTIKTDNDGVILRNNYFCYKIPTFCKENLYEKYIDMLITKSTELNKLNSIIKPIKRFETNK